jgi:cyclase
MRGRKEASEPHAGRALRACAAMAVIVTASLGVGEGRQQPAGRDGPSSRPAAGGDAVGVLAVRPNLYMLVTSDGNVAVQTGPDGVLLVDAGPESLAAQLAGAIRGLSDAPLHTIVNTSAGASRTGGTGALVKLLGGSPAPRVMAQENVLRRLQEAGSKTALAINASITAPVTATYYTPTHDFFLNGEAVILRHAPSAHSDGDTIVHFRGSDVLAVGSLFTPDLYPVIDVAKGGSVNGKIAALNRILEITVPAKYQEGGTYVIPGRGRLCDEADVVEYRDMVTIIRDRVQSMVDKGMTLAQVKAARPTRDFDTEYGATEGPWTNEMFLEAVYRSLSDGTSTQ